MDLFGWICLGTCFLRKQVPGDKSPVQPSRFFAFPAVDMYFQGLVIRKLKFPINSNIQNGPGKSRPKQGVLMKSISVLILGVMFLSLPLIVSCTQEGLQGPASMSGGYTESSGLAQAVLTPVSEAKKLRDKTWVALRGKIVRAIREEEYEFSDDSGAIPVEIDWKAWQGISVDENTPVEIQGYVEYEKFGVEIEVKSLSIQEGFQGAAGAPGYIGPGSLAQAALTLVSEAKKLSDKTPVALRGKIIKAIREEKYEFSDDSGVIPVEIDWKVWQGIPVDENTLVEIRGYVEYKRLGVEIEVKSLSILGGI